MRETELALALSVPPLFHIPLRGARPPIPITVQRLSMHPIETRITADVPSVPGGEQWGWGRPIAVLDLRRSGQRTTVNWVPPLLPGLPTYPVLIRVGDAEAVVRVVGAPEGTDSEITGGFGQDPRSPIQYCQLAFQVKPPDELRITSSSVKQMIGVAFQLTQQAVQPTLFRLWASAERTGGVALSWHYLLHVQYQGDLRDMSQLASALDRAASLSGIEIRTRVATWGS